MFSFEEVSKLVDQGNNVNQVAQVAFENLTFSLWTYRKMNIKTVGGFLAI